MNFLQSSNFSLTKRREVSGYGLRGESDESVDVVYILLKEGMEAISHLFFRSILRNYYSILLISLEYRAGTTQITVPIVFIHFWMRHQLVS